MSDNPKTQDRAVHRPVSVFIEKISAIPDLREIPMETEITINLKMTRLTARQLMEFLQSEIARELIPDQILVTIKGKSW